MCHRITLKDIKEAPIGSVVFGIYMPKPDWYKTEEGWKRCSLNMRRLPPLSDEELSDWNLDLLIIPYNL